MGVSYMQLNDPAKAIECFGADLEIARELGDLAGQAASLGNLGWARAILGDADGAARLLETRIEVSRRIGDRRGEAESSWALGNIYEEMGDLARAVELKQVFVDYRQGISHPRAADLTAEVVALRVRLGQAAVAATSEPAVVPTAVDPSG
jgi:tetratricopeptide (TPR) repeat protein